MLPFSQFRLIRGYISMIMQKDFIERLKLFGLNSYEAKIWVALLSRGVSSAGELSDISNVPRSRSYDILESLEKKGFIVMKIGKPIKYIAVPPNEVLERVKQRVRQEAESQANNLSKLKESDLLTELSSLHTKGVDLVEPTDLTASFRGQERVYDQMHLMLKESEEEFILVTTALGLARKADYLLRGFKKAHERGVSIKIAAPLGKETEEAQKLLAPYADIRNLEHVRARFAVADGKEVTFLLFDDEDIHPSYDVGIWANTPFFAQTIQQLFALVWDDLKQVKVQ
jgi:sugar-specific transcriptional regulator TrmB